MVNKWMKKMKKSLKELIHVYRNQFDDFWSMPG